MWPLIRPKENNLIINNLENVEVINCNLQRFYLDHTNMSSYDMDLCDNKIDIVNCQNIIDIQISSAMDEDTVIFDKIYHYNFHWDFDHNDENLFIKKKWNDMNQINQIYGCGIVLCSKTINHANIQYKLLPSLPAMSELLWKFSPDHAPDNTLHGIYRLAHHMQKLKKKPYCGHNLLSIGENISRPFPLGCEMVDDFRGSNGKGNIDQSYLDNHYARWNIQIKPMYQGHINNNLMYNINPLDENDYLAITQMPLGAIWIYGKSQDNKDVKSRLRINPFLAKDIKRLLNDDSDLENTEKIGRTNFSSQSRFYENDSFYRDMRDSVIIIKKIQTPNL